jgi:hypothetical protein
LFELLAVFFQLAIDGLETQGVLGGGGAISGTEIGGGFGAQITLLGFELADLRHQAFAQAGVRSQALVILGDLFTKVFGFDLQKGLRILFFEAGDEKSEESPDKISKSLKHAAILLCASACFEL